MCLEFLLYLMSYQECGCLIFSVVCSVYNQVHLTWKRLKNWGMREVHCNNIVFILQKNHITPREVIFELNYTIIPWLPLLIFIVNRRSSDSPLEHPGIWWGSCYSIFGLDRGLSIFVAVCRSAIYGIWLSLWYLQTLLTNSVSKPNRWNVEGLPEKNYISVSDCI